jgi:molybdopterin-guanine dinucleotide biosynthesis protein A
LKANCIILAGGRGLRFGQQKASVQLNNETLIQRTVSGLRFLDSEIIVVIAEGQKPPRITDYPRLKIVTDAYTGKGPLVGIYTGLIASNSPHNLVVACDMPLLNRDLLRYMLELAEGHDVVIPRMGTLIEPLHAVYSKECIGVVEQMLAEEILKIEQILNRVKVRYVEVGEIDRFDPEHRSFFNINTRADLMKVKEIIR